MSRRKKYSYSQRLNAVLEVREQHRSLCSVARSLETDHKQIRRWVALYEHHGLEGLRKTNDSYTGDFKLSVVRYMYENHLSLFETAVKFGIPNDSTVLQWDRIYRKEGSAGLFRANRGKMKRKDKPKQEKSSDAHCEETDLRKELEILRAENAFLKKLKALVQERIARESWNEQKPSMN
jgi:transposase